MGKAGETSGSAFLAFRRIGTSSWEAHICQPVDASWYLYLQTSVLLACTENVICKYMEGEGKPGICVAQGNLGRFSTLVDFPTLLFKGRIGPREMWDQMSNIH